MVDPLGERRGVAQIEVPEHAPARSNLDANQTSNALSVLLNNGNGIFGPSVDYLTGMGPSSVAALDLNGDGRPDLAVVNVSVHGPDRATALDPC